MNLRGTWKFLDQVKRTGLRSVSSFSADRVTMKPVKTDKQTNIPAKTSPPSLHIPPSSSPCFTIVRPTTSGHPLTQERFINAFEYAAQPASRPATSNRERYSSSVVNLQSLTQGMKPRYDDPHKISNYENGFPRVPSHTRTSILVAGRESRIVSCRNAFPSRNKSALAILAFR